MVGCALLDVLLEALFEGAVFGDHGGILRDREVRIHDV